MVVYPAIFHKSIEGGYVVVFPDFDYGATEGKNIGGSNRNGRGLCWYMAI